MNKQIRSYPEDPYGIDKMFLKFFYKGMVIAYLVLIVIVIPSLDTFLISLISLLGICLVVWSIFINKIANGIKIDFDNECFEFLMVINGKFRKYGFEEIINIDDSLWITFETNNKKIYLNSHLGGDALLNDIKRFKKSKWNY